jgi:hypothetical protein
VAETPVAETKRIRVGPWARRKARANRRLFSLHFIHAISTSSPTATYLASICTCLIRLQSFACPNIICKRFQQCHFHLLTIKRNMQGATFILGRSYLDSTDWALQNLGPEVPQGYPHVAELFGVVRDTRVGDVRSNVRIRIRRISPLILYKDIPASRNM